MKKQIILVAVTLLTFLGIVQADESDSIFNPDKIIEVEIEMLPSDWDFIRVQERPEDMYDCVECQESPFPSPYIYKMAKVTINGQTLDSVGVRKKGFLGSTADWLGGHDKPSLKIKFDEYVGDQELFGLERMTFNNNCADGSQLRQYIAYSLFRKAGIPAVRCNSARVTVNGTYIGLYSNIEDMKKRFLARHYTDNSGNLYEGTDSDFREGWTSTFELKTNKSNPNPADILNLTDALKLPDSSVLAAVSGVLDTAKFYKYWSLEALTNQGDGYVSDCNNYFFYVNPQSGLIEFIPWGIDKAFFPYIGDEVIEARSMLPRRLYNIALSQSQFAGTCQFILDSIYNENELLAEIEAMETLLAPHIEWTTHLIYNITFSEAVEELREFIQGRRAVMQGALDSLPAQYKPPLRKSPCGDAVNTPGNLVINEMMSKNTSGTADQDGKYDDWIELYNNTSSPINLTGYYLSDTYGDLQKWKFPAGTSIGANDYLIIWADKDSLQTGLHVNFKLSAAGSEWIYLVDPSSKVVDKRGLSFQRRNISFGRYPNGTGDFQFMNPTFGKENINVVSIHDKMNVPSPLFSLGQNYPNPIRTITTIRYTLPAAGKVKLTVYNICGKEVKELVNDVQVSGLHSVKWDGKDKAGKSVSSGVYVCKMQAADRVLMRSMILSK